MVRLAATDALDTAMRHSLVRSLAPLLLALAAACGAAGSGSTADLAPPPFTAEEIRAANPEGTQLLFRVDALGSPAMLRRMTFVATDAQGATIESSRSALHGEPMGGLDAQHSSWVELRDHAAFPAARTTRREATCRVQAGEYACWEYVVEQGVGEDGLPLVSRFWFAHSKPGPPVLMESLRGGVRVLRMELVEERRP